MLSLSQLNILIEQQDVALELLSEKIINLDCAMSRLAEEKEKVRQLQHQYKNERKLVLEEMAERGMRT